MKYCIFLRPGLKPLPLLRIFPNLSGVRKRSVRPKQRSARMRSESRVRAPVASRLYRMRSRFLATSVLLSHCIFCVLFQTALCFAPALVPARRACARGQCRPGRLHILGAADDSVRRAPPKPMPKYTTVCGESCERYIVPSLPQS